MPDIYKNSNKSHLLSEQFLSFKAVVVGVENINTQIVRIKLKGTFHGFIFCIGDTVSIKTKDGHQKKHLPSNFNVDKGLCELIFCRDQFENNIVVEDMALGTTVDLVICKGKAIHTPQEQLHFLFGDESALGFFSFMISTVEQLKQKYTGVLELDRANLFVPMLLGIDIVTVPKIPNGTGGEFAIEWIKGLGLFMTERLKKASFYLVGNTTSLQRFLAVLLSLGIRDKQIKTCISLQEN